MNRTSERHGMSGTLTYQNWAAMISRCYNERSPHYRNYGGRGIKVCEQWLRSFCEFYAHVGERPSKTHTLDRIDNNKGYEPGNVRWATRKEQQCNRRTNVNITYGNETRCASEWARLVGIDVGTIIARLRKGLPIEEVLRPREFRAPELRGVWYNKTGKCWMACGPRRKIIGYYRTPEEGSAAVAAYMKNPDANSGITYLPKRKSHSLSDAQVEMILADPRSERQIASEFGVERHTIRSIKRAASDSCKLMPKIAVETGNFTPQPYLCFCCGKNVTPSDCPHFIMDRHTLEVVDPHSVRGAAEEVAGEYMSPWPIGPECRKKYHGIERYACDRHGAPIVCKRCGRIRTLVGDTETCGKCSQSQVATMVSQDQ